MQSLITNGMKLTSGIASAEGGPKFFANAASLYSDRHKLTEVTAHSFVALLSVCWAGRPEVAEWKVSEALAAR